MIENLRAEPLADEPGIVYLVSETKAVVSNHLTETRSWPLILIILP